MEEVKEEYHGCYNCSRKATKFVERKDPYGSDKTWWCTSCFNRNFFHCFLCGQDKPQRDKVRDYENNGDLHIFNQHGSICIECLQSEFVSCTICNQFYLPENTKDRICINCEDNYFTCKVCGNNFNNNYSVTCDVCGEVTCQGDCPHIHFDEKHRINFVFEPFKSGLKICYGENKGELIRIERPVGIEIEAEFGDADKFFRYAPRCVQGHHDGSLETLGDNEFILPPTTLCETERLVTEVCRCLRESGWKVTKKCSVHINMDMTKFDSNFVNVTHIIKTFYAIEDLIFSMMPPSRWTTHYCTRLSSIYDARIFRSRSQVALELKWYKENDPDRIVYRKQEKYDASRYVGTNIHALFWKKRLEFRYLNGSLNARKILLWTNFLLKVVDWIVNSYDDKAVQKLYKMETSEEKLQYMFRVFGIDKEVCEWIRDRVYKFNAGFQVKFSQVKADAEIVKRAREIWLPIAQKEFRMNEGLREQDFRKYRMEVAQLELLLNSPGTRRFLRNPQIRELFENLNLDTIEFDDPELGRFILPVGQDVELSEEICVA